MITKDGCNLYIAKHTTPKENAEEAVQIILLQLYDAFNPKYLLLASLMNHDCILLLNPVSILFSSVLKAFLCPRYPLSIFSNSFLGSSCVKSFSNALNCCEFTDYWY